MSLSALAACKARAASRIVEIEPTLSSTTRDTYLPRDMQDRGKPPARSETVDIDKALVDELNLSLDEPMISAKHPPAKQDVSLEDEMNKLLGELTGGRRK